MSHRALILEKQQDGRIAHRHSQTGAQDFELLEAIPDARTIHGHVDWSQLARTRQTGNIDTIAPQRFGSRDSTTVENNTQEPLVEQGVIEYSESLHEAYDSVSGLYEGVYLVDEQDVEFIKPIWTFPDIFGPWVHSDMQLDIYRRPELEPPLGKSIEQSDPAFEIANPTADQLKALDPEAEEVIQDYHRWMYQQIAAGHQRSSQLEDRDVADLQATVVTEDYALVMSDICKPNFPFAGYPAFLPIRITGPRHGSLERRVIEESRRARYNAGMALRLNAPVSEDDYSDAAENFLTDVLDMFGNHADQRLLPPEKQWIIEKL